jgi:hypothetical protein
VQGFALLATSAWFTRSGPTAHIFLALRTLSTILIGFFLACAFFSLAKLMCKTLSIVVAPVGIEIPNRIRGRVTLTICVAYKVEAQRFGLFATYIGLTFGGPTALSLLAFIVTKHSSTTDLSLVFASTSVCSARSCGALLVIVARLRVFYPLTSVKAKPPERASIGFATFQGVPRSVPAVIGIAVMGIVTVLIAFLSDA